MNKNNNKFNSIYGLGVLGFLIEAFQQPKAGHTDLNKLLSPPKLSSTQTQMTHL